MFAAFLLTSLTISVSAQKSQKTSIDKKIKSAANTTKPEVKVAAKPKVVAKKVEPPPPKKEPTPKRVIIQPKPKLAKTVVAKPKRSRFIKVLFKTTETGLEIEIDKKGFFVNKKPQIEIPLTVGKHLIYVRRNGQAITDQLELTVSPNQEDIDLSEYIKDFSQENDEKVKPDEVEQKSDVEIKKSVPVKTDEPDETNLSAEEKLMNKSVGLNLVSNNIDSILLRFNQPDKVDSVSLNDWTYVYQQTTQYQVLPRYTKDKINLVNKFSEGMVSYHQANYIQAINSLLGAVSISLLLKEKLGKEMPITYYGLGLAYLASKDYQRAKEAFSKSIRIDAEFAMAYSRLGDAYKANGEGKQALTYYLTAHKRNYKTFESSLNLANSLKLYKSYQEAIDLYKELGKEKPSSEIYISMGDCYVELERLSPAIDSFRRALELDSKSAIANSKLGDVFVEIKDFQLAIESWQKALDLDREGRYIVRKKIEEKIKKAKKRKS
jgi:tetratricopeptide (TPR) repeat protein